MMINVIKVKIRSTTMYINVEMYVGMDTDDDSRNFLSVYVIYYAVY